VCATEFPIREGVAWFGVEEPPAPGIGPIGNAADDAERLAAQLGLDERGGLWLLVGSWGALASVFSAAESVQLMLVSPPAGVDAWSTVRGAGDALPFAEGSLRGVAIDRTSAALAQAAAKALVPNGRMVAPAGTPVPAVVTVLARDDRQWVGVRTVDPARAALVTPLRAAPRRDPR
jgi:hypothetical protein